MDLPNGWNMLIVIQVLVFVFFKIKIRKEKMYFHWSPIGEIQFGTAAKGNSVQTIQKSSREI